MVCDEDDGSLLGYFTITHKAVEVPPDGLSKTTTRRVEKYAQLHKKLNAFIVSGFLIAQFGKNYGVDEGHICNYSAGLRIYCADRTKTVNSAMQRVNNEYFGGAI